MSWTVEFSDTAKKQLKKLGKVEQKRIVKYLRERVISLYNPREVGKNLKGELSDFWRYRVGDYRLICHLKDDVLVVLVLNVGHRKDIYRR